MDLEKKCSTIENVDGHISNGTQFDIDIILPEDNRGVIYGVVKNCYKEPVCDAVVKLIEIDYDCGKKIRTPVTHTFTDKDGEFVFGPICPNKHYDIQIWVNKVKHVKICSKCHREGECLKPMNIRPCECFIGKREDLDNCKKNFLKNDNDN